MYVVINIPIIKLNYLQITASRDTVISITIMLRAERKGFVTGMATNIFLFLQKPTPPMGRNLHPISKKFGIPSRSKTVV